MVENKEVPFQKQKPDSSFTPHMLFKVDSRNIKYLNIIIEIIKCSIRGKILLQFFIGEDFPRMTRNPEAIKKKLIDLTP